MIPVFASFALVASQMSGAGTFLDVAIARVETASKVVALTFDACATHEQSNDFDWSIFDVLRKENIPVTVYLTGRWIETHLVEARQLAAEDQLEFGNHAYSHPRLPQLEDEVLEREITLTNELIASLGRKPSSMRPPAGSWNRRVLQATQKVGLPLVLWDVVSGDVDGKVPATQMIKHVLGQTRPGSIVIFHINGRGPHTKKALPDIISGLRGQGFGFVTVGDLFALPDAKAVPYREVGPQPRRVVAAPGEKI